MNNENSPATKKDLQEILEVVNQGFNEQTKIIAEINQKVDNVNQKVDNVNQKVDNVNQKVDNVNQKVDNVNQKVDNSEKEVEKRHKEILASNEKVLASNEKIAKSINDMRQEQTAHQGGHIRTNNTLLEHDDKLENHEKRIIKLEPLSQSV